MLSACVVDAIQERSRGRWVGSNNLLQGFGVVAMSLGLAKLPNVVRRPGRRRGQRRALRLLGGRGNCRPRGGHHGPGLPRVAARTTTAGDARLGASVLQAARLARANPRLAVAYGAAFIGRGDFVIIGAFFSLWITQAGMAAGLTPAASVARGGMLFGILQLAAMGWAFFMGMIADRVDRITGLCIALGLATAGYLLLGQVDDPFGRGFIPVAILVGMGEISVIVASGALLGQEAPAVGRGPVIGLYNAIGGVGILFATLAGGYVFDHLGPTVPFTMMAVLNAVLLGAALLVRRARPPGATVSLQQGNS